METVSPPDVPLSIQLLGQFHLTYQGLPVPGFHSPRLQALLASILLNRGNPFSRQQLAFRLWPDSSDGQARTNLRHLLHTLRSILPEANDYLQIMPNTIGWNFSVPAFIDVLEFEKAASHIDSPDSIQRAVELYQGILLTDCYDDWIEPERSRLQDLFYATLSCLIEHQAKAGNYTGAIRSANLLLHSDPLRESTYCRLMEIHALIGDRAGVVRVYDTCAAVLDKELGIEPGAETKAAFHAWREYSKPVVSQVQASDEVEILSKGFQSRNLPLPLDQLIGREEEKRQIIEQISQYRIVTLTGFGGVGKTRLAQAVAWEIASSRAPILDLEEIWWIDLAPISDPDLLYPAVAASFHIPELGNRPVVESILDILGKKRILVVIDNCEHLLETAAQFIITLMKSCPAVRVMTTSRVSLHLQGEVVIYISPLSTLAPETATLSESEMLFCERASATNPAFLLRPEYREAVRSICRRLDGIPLAIEMAAARIRMFNPLEIAARLDDAFRLLSQKKREVIPRHQTMRAALDWSYNLLTEPEKQLLRRLYIFTGSFSLTVAESVVPFEIEATNNYAGSIQPEDVLDRLAGLIEHSLVAVEETTLGTRYRLHEVTRQYAAIKLAEVKEEAKLRRNYLTYYTRFVRDAEAGIQGQDLIFSLRRVDLEVENVRAAIEWSLSSSVDEGIETGMKLVGGMWLYWFIRARLEEGLYWAEKALEADLSSAMPPDITGKVLYTAASLALFQGLVDKGDVYTEGSLEKCQQVGDLVGMAISMHHKGMVAGSNGKYRLAEKYFKEALRIARQAGDLFWEGCMLVDLGDGKERAGNIQEAKLWYQESLVVAREAQNPFSLAYSLLNLASISIQLGEIQQASLYNNECLAIVKEMDDPRLFAFTLDTKAEIAALEGRLEEAEALWRAGMQIYVEVNDRRNLLNLLEKLAWAASQRGDCQQAIYLLGSIQNRRQQLGLVTSVSQANMITEVRHFLIEQAGTELFDSIYQSGMNSSIEQAVTCAMDGKIP